MSDLIGKFRNVKFHCQHGDIPENFFIVTAFNPNVETVDLLLNQFRNEKLKGEIERLGFNFFPVTGGNVGFLHSEPGYGICCNRESALLLARQSEQLAIFEVSDGKVILIAALDDPEPDEVIGLWSDLLSG